MKRRVWRRRKDGVKQRYHIGRKKKRKARSGINWVDRRAMKDKSVKDTYKSQNPITERDFQIEVSAEISRLRDEINNPSTPSDMKSYLRQKKKSLEQVSEY